MHWCLCCAFQHNIAIVAEGNKHQHQHIVPNASTTRTCSQKQATTTTEAELTGAGLTTGSVQHSAEAGGALAHSHIIRKADCDTCAATQGACSPVAYMLRADLVAYLATEHLPASDGKRRQRPKLSRQEPGSQRDQCNSPPKR
jgi:hypothetical protein